MIMGWLFLNHCTTRAELIEHLRRDHQTMTRSELIRSQARGNHFWALCRRKDTGAHWISLCLMQGSKHDHCWGYKDMDESMGPYYYNCPVSYLDAPTDEQTANSKWRAAVRAHHAKQAARPKPAPGLHITYNGQIYTLAEPVTHWGRNTGQWRVTDQHGQTWRMTAQQIKRSEPA